MGFELQNVLHIPLVPLLGVKTSKQQGRTWLLAGSTMCCLLSV